jgi:hypothetical protein
MCNGTHQRVGKSTSNGAIRCRTFCLPVCYIKNINIKIYKTIILSVVLYGYETWSRALRKEHRLRVLRRIFGPKRDEVTGNGENYIMKSLMLCTAHSILFG